MEVSEMFGKRAKGTWRDVLFVDPGLGGTGLAYWHDIVRPCSEAMVPDWTTVLRSRAPSWLGRFSDVDEAFAAIEVQELNYIVIEEPELWTSSAKSMSSAARGTLFKLCYLVGGLMEASLATWGQTPLLVPARTWKGQLDDKAVDARIKRALGRKYRRHEAEAVGMGLAAQGVL